MSETTSHTESPAARGGFDFDAWSALARADPKAFEAARRRAVDARIQRAPKARRRRLRGLQFRIDMERIRAHTPMGGCVRLSTMMWDSVLGEDGLYDQLRVLADFIETGERPAHPVRPPARILPFPADPKD